MSDMISIKRTLVRREHLRVDTIVLNTQLTKINGMALLVHAEGLRKLMKYTQHCGKGRFWIQD